MSGAEAEDSARGPARNTMPIGKNTRANALAHRWSDEKEKDQWYAGGFAYWSGEAATNDGMLGGFADVDVADTADSLKFMKRCGALPESQRNGGSRVIRALDVGAGMYLPLTAYHLPPSSHHSPLATRHSPLTAHRSPLATRAGIGRVTNGPLLQLADTVDLLESDAKFVERAKGALAWAAPRVERFHCQPMQEFVPEAGRYDLIWIQWCVGCLTDDDLVLFMGQCKAGLAPGGVIVIKVSNPNPDPNPSPDY